MYVKKQYMLFVMLFSLVLVGSFSLIGTVFAQMADPIVVTTNQESYAQGETIIIYGEVRELLSGFPVTLQVIAPNGNVVALDQLVVSADKTFGIELTSEGPLWRSSGDYTAKVLYGTESRTSETTFEIIIIVPPSEKPIKGIPNQFILRAGDEPLNDVQYQINFDFLNNGYQIKEVHKGTFDASEQLPNGVIFYEDKILPNEARTGVVVFSYNEGLEPEKGNYEVTLTANGVSKTKTVDPVWIITIVTDVIQALPDLLDFIVGVEEQIEPCAQLDVDETPYVYTDLNAKFHVEIENCSNHREQFRLNFMGNNVEVPRFDPSSSSIDLPSGGEETVTLTINVQDNLPDKIYGFTVTTDIIMDFLGREWEYTNYKSDHGEYEIYNGVVVPEFPFALFVLTMSLIPVLIISRKILKK